MEIDSAENKVRELETMLAGTQDPHPLNNAKVLDDLEEEFKNSERY